MKKERPQMKKTLTRQDAYDAANWEQASDKEIECIFEENDELYRAFIKTELITAATKPQELDTLVKRAIELAEPIQIMWPITDSFMHMCYQKPPVWKQIMAAFRINVETTIFTFGDIIYNPSQHQIPDDYIHHEEVHAEQQGHNPEGAGRWWARYFSDPYFRIDQEAKAYAVQYDWWCKNGPKKVRANREQRALKLHDLAITLASPTYGNVVNVEAAKKLIKSFSKTK